MAKPAVTEYFVVKTIAKGDGGDDGGGDKGRYALLKVNPLTGRTHQIRVHLASIGHPIVGDALYGRKTDAASVSRLMLHAAALMFSDDAGNRFEFAVPLPSDFSYPQGGHNAAECCTMISMRVMKRSSFSKKINKH
jgi:23S rRNA-/tRNA-specific pseudouridylate synthase